MPDPTKQAAPLPNDPGLVDWIADTLADLCRVDTTPRVDIGALAASEAAAFDVIEARLKGLGLPDLRLSRPPIDPAIGKHRFYSNPAYAARDGVLPSPADAYRGRSNLVVALDGADGKPGLAFNAHVDVVHPYIPPRVDAGVLYGRGACDDKGPLVAILAALRLVAQHLATHRQRLRQHLSMMCVIDEESGGNGSLAMAVDRELRRRYDTIMVIECCSSRIYPGNRGAVWYQVTGALPGVNMLEAAAFIIEEMELAGRSIKAESRHPLFPHRPVQTCHGMIGRFGEHPSRICGRVEFILRAEAAARWTPDARAVVDDLLATGLQEYIGLYGDKTQVIDPTTGRPKVARHFEVEARPEGLRVIVHGASGHMGAILANDGAITKMAAMVRALVRSRPALEHAAGGPVKLELADWDTPAELAMEGGQGFLPTHPMEAVQQRIEQAVWRGAERYLRLVGDAANAGRVQGSIRTTFQKLHNAAFAADPDSPPMRDAIAAAREAGIWPENEPIRGWDVSCDARLFACEYPDDLTVLTGGPGHLVHAHADDEQIKLDEVADFARFIAAFILRRCGVVSTDPTPPAAAKPNR